VLQVEVQRKSSLLAPVTFILAAVAMISSACATISSMQVIEHGIVVREFTGDIAQSSAVVKGAAINSGAWPITGCKVEIIYYDYAGNKIGTSVTTRDRLEANERWNFQTELKGENAWRIARYDIVTEYK